MKLGDAWESLNPPDAPSVGEDVLDDDEEQAKRTAESIDCDLIIATPRTLLLDFDNTKQYDVYRSNRDLLELHGGGIRQSWQWPSSSGLPGHIHVMIEFYKELNPYYRCALALLMGSDPYRENMNLRRLAAGMPEGSRLFKPKKVILQPRFKGEEF